jgi:hypothetical protein
VGLGRAKATLVGCAGALLLLLAGIPSSRGEPSASEPSLRLDGPRRVVFDWSEQACAAAEQPDLPVRAFRDAKGRVQMLLSHYESFRMVGPSLDRLRVDCRPLMRSPQDPDPSRYRDRRWLASLYTDDGRHILALVHHEYQGHRHAGRCPEHAYLRCWYNAITLASSSDGGRTYRQARPPRHFVAGAPYRYRHGSGPTGVFAPSNLVRRGRYLYALVRVRDRARAAGDCLIRADRPAQPSAWRAWADGRFGVRFVDPYRGRPRPAVGCDRISPNRISEMSESLTFNTALDRYLLVGIADPLDRRARGRGSGLYFSLSRDLVHWSPRRLLLAAPTLHTYRCGGPSPIAYPSIVSPESRSRTFMTSGMHPYLYFTQFRYWGCRKTADRDLVRVRLKVLG